jgi:hypothetical protein
MKIRYIKLTIMLLLPISVAYNFQPVEAESSCWQAAVNRWLSCDEAYSFKVSQYNNQNAICQNNSAIICSNEAGSYCSGHAATVCNGSNNYSTCYSNMYNSCYSAQYASCVTSTTNQCLININSAYNNRSMDYGSCLHPIGNAGNCTEELQSNCSEAMDRYNLCGQFYEDDLDAAMACRSASGYDGAGCI